MPEKETPSEKIFNQMEEFSINWKNKIEKKYKDRPRYAQKVREMIERADTILADFEAPTSKIMQYPNTPEDAMVIFEQRLNTLEEEMDRYIARYERFNNAA